jgi:hypothetical protein
LSPHSEQGQPSVLRAHRRAKLAPLRLSRNIAQTLRASSRRRVRRLLNLSHQMIHRYHHKEIHRQRRNHKSQQHVEEIAVKKFAPIHRKAQPQKVRQLPPAKAAPITTPTAKSTTFPRSKNVLNPRMVTSQSARSLPHSRLDNSRRLEPQAIFWVTSSARRLPLALGLCRIARRVWEAGHTIRAAAKNCHSDRSEPTPFLRVHFL